MHVHVAAPAHLLRNKHSHLAVSVATPTIISTLVPAKPLKAVRLVSASTKAGAPAKAPAHAHAHTGVGAGAGKAWQGRLGRLQMPAHTNTHTHRGARKGREAAGAWVVTGCPLSCR